jgi:hypothetical protein
VRCRNIYFMGSEINSKGKKEWTKEELQEGDRK